MPVRVPSLLHLSQFCHGLGFGPVSAVGEGMLPSLFGAVSVTNDGTV